MLSPGNHHGRNRAGRARHHEAGAAPEKVVAPHSPQRPRRRRGNRAGDQAGIDDEVGGDGPDQRPRQETELRPARAARRGSYTRAPVATMVIASAAMLNSVRYTGYGRLDLDRALREHARDGDHHRVLRTEQQQRHEVGGVGHRQRRAAGERQRQIDLPQRGEAGRDQQAGEEQRLIERRGQRSERAHRHRRSQTTMT